jgi:Tfp pilus assembly protein PilN
MSDTTSPASSATGGFKSLIGRFKRKPHAAAGLDFLPEDYADKKAKRRADVILLSLFGVTVVAIGTTWHLCETELAEAEAEFAAVDARHAEAARRIEQVRQMRERQKSVRDRMELSASLLERMPRSNLLAEITNTLPHGVVLSKAQLEAKKVKAPPPPKAAKKTKKRKEAAPERPQPLKFDTTLAIEGTSLTEGQVSDYMDALKRGQYFKSVDIMWVRRMSNRGNGDGPADLSRFLIALKLDPAAEPRPNPLDAPVGLALTEFTPLEDPS